MPQDPGIIKSNNCLEKRAQGFSAAKRGSLWTKKTNKKTPQKKHLASPEKVRVLSGPAWQAPGHQFKSPLSHRCQTQGRQRGRRALLSVISAARAMSRHVSEPQRGVYSHALHTGKYPGSHKVTRTQPPCPVCLS